MYGSSHCPHLWVQLHVSPYPLKYSSLFCDLALVYLACQQFVGHLDALTVPLWQYCPSWMCSSVAWTYDFRATSMYDNQSSWSCIHELEGNNPCLNHISDMLIIHKCSNQQKWHMPWNHGLTTSMWLEASISTCCNSRTLPLLSIIVSIIQSMVSVSHLVVDQELLDQVRWGKGTWTHTSYK
jgi:hypothetical protein